VDVLDERRERLVPALAAVVLGIVQTRLLDLPGEHGHVRRQVPRRCEPLPGILVFGCHVDLHLGSGCDFRLIKRARGSKRRRDPPGCFYGSIASMLAMNMQGLDDDIEEALRHCDEQKDPAKRERCKERVIATRFKAMQLKIDGTKTDIANLSVKIDDLPTRMEFQEQARSIQEIFTTRVDEATSGRADARFLQGIADDIQATLKEFGMTVAKKTDLEKLATKEDLARVEEVMATKENLKAFATKDDVKAEIKNLDAKLDKILERGK
jgi:hypothetical protein